MNCPQCEKQTDEIPEGVCSECQEQNQSVLDQHIAELDHWEMLTPAQRQASIRFAMH